MPKSTNFADNFLKLLDTNLAYANVGDAAGLQPSGAAGNLYVSLHTGDPGLTGDQTVNEATYTGYARVPVVRSAVGWTVTANQVVNAATITFGLCTGVPNTITWVGIGTALGGAGQLLYAFPLVQTWYACFGEPTANQIHQLSGLSANDPIQFLTAPGGALPTPIAQGTTYYVKTILGADLFTISTVAGGAVLTITVEGFGLVGKISPLTVVAGVTPVFLPGQLLVQEV